MISPDWCPRMTKDSLVGTLHWFSSASRQAMASPGTVTANHFLSRPSRCRGQAHTPITQAGIRPVTASLRQMVVPGHPSSHHDRYKYSKNR